MITEEEMQALRLKSKELADKVVPLFMEALKELEKTDPKLIHALNNCNCEDGL